MPVYQTNAHISSPSFQPNQGYGAHEIHPWSVQMEPVRVLNSALTPGDEVLIAANTIYWLSRDRKCVLDYSRPQNHRSDAYNGTPSAKKRKAISSANKKSLYRCDECGVEFASYHALGGHKSGHRKVEARLRAAAAQVQQQQQQQLQPQEISSPPPAPLSPPPHAKHLFDLNEPPPE